VTPNHTVDTLCDPAEIIKAVKLLCDGGVTELRALNATIGRSTYQTTWSGYFDDPAKLAEAVGTLAGFTGCYIIPNAVNPDLLARRTNRIGKAGKGAATTDSDIIRRRWLLIDLDAQRPTGISATDSEHEAARDKARTIYRYLCGFSSWPEPIVADSGNGSHMLFRIDLPADDGGIIKRCLAALSARFSDAAVEVDESVFNPGRIWKLPGTLACKGDSTAERPHRMARLLRVPDAIEIVPVSLLEALAAEVPDDTQAAQSNGHRVQHSSGGGQSFDIEGFIQRHNLDVSEPKPWEGGNLWVLKTSPLCEHADGAAWIAQGGSGALAAGCHHDHCSWGWRELRAALEPDRMQHSRSNGKPARDKATLSKPEPVLVCLNDIEPKNVTWLWRGRVPQGRITLLVGRPGEGKSFLSCDLAARVSTGTPWPDGADCESGSVIFITGEDDPADTIRPRLDAHYAAAQRIHLLSAVKSLDADGEFERMLILADVSVIEQALTRIPDCKLVVIDPIGSFLGGKTDANRDNEVRAVLAPIAQLAEKHGAAVLIVAHRRKSTGNYADDLALGSRGFTGIARSVLHLSSDPDNKRRRLLLPGKNNLAEVQTGLAFTIGGDPPSLCWEHDPVAMTADDGLAAETAGSKHGPEAEAEKEAIEYLRHALGSGPRLVKEIQEESREGFFISKRTLDRAKQRIRVESFRPENPGPWWWRLPSSTSPEQDANSPQVKQLGDLGNVPQNRTKTSISDTETEHIAKLFPLGNVPPDTKKTTDAIDAATEQEGESWDVI